MRSHSTLILLLLSLPLAPNGWGNEFPGKMQQLLDRHGIAKDSVSIEVRKIGEPAPVLSLNAERPRNPGSVIKLVTTLAALELLGPSYTWRTEYRFNGKLRDGRLTGDLVLRGGGDPYLVVEQLWLHLRALRDRGLQEIGGDLVLDDSALAVQGGDRGSFDGQSERVYNVIPSATMVNYSATHFVFLPQQGKLSILANPPATNLRVDNRITLTDGACNKNRSLRPHRIERDKDQTVIVFDGTYPASCGEFARTLAVLPNADYTYGVFRAMWQQLGGTLEGDLRHGKSPQTAPVLSVSSRSLREVISGINKFSNNAMARLLLLTIGRELYGEPGSIDSGIRGIKRWLEKSRIQMPQLLLDNGAGLSRVSRASARGLGNLLQAGWDSSFRPEYLASLSIVATDGTARKRLTEEQPEGRIRIKTGLLNNTRTLAGYVRSRSGNYFSVVLLLNGKKIGYQNGNQLQDALLRWVLAR